MKNKKNKKLKSPKNDTTAIINRLKNRFVVSWLFMQPLVRKNLGHAFRFLSILFVIVVYFGLGKLLSPLFDAASSTGIYSLSDTIPSNSSRPTINLILGEPNWGTAHPYVPAKFNGKVELPEKLLWANGGCFQHLFLFATVEESSYIQAERFGRGSYPGIGLNPSVCFDDNNKPVVVKTRPNETWGDPNPRISGIPSYYYPFDWGEINLRIRLDGSENLESSSESRYIPVNLTGYVNAKNWDVKTSITDGADPSSLPNEVIRPYVLLNIRYDRPLVYRVIPAVLLSTILLIIILMPKIKDNGSFLEVLIGLIFGIWGIRQVVIPTFVTWTTIVEPIILGLYMCLCISVFIKFCVIPLQSTINKIAQDTNE